MEHTPASSPTGSARSGAGARPIPARPERRALGRGGSRGHGLASLANRLIIRLGLTPRLVAVAVGIFLASRLALIALTGATLHYLHKPIPPAALLGPWESWDASIYATIAHDGYGGGAAGLYRAAFFPLQPLLARLASPVTGGDTRLSAILVANLAFLGALLGMAALARLDQDDGAAVRGMLLLTCYPLAFFTFAGYSESVFLFCVVWSLVALRREWWVGTSVLGLGAGLARQVGLLLMIPCALAHYRPAAICHRPAAICRRLKGQRAFILRGGGRSFKLRGRLRNLDVSALGVISPLLGLALFSLWQWGSYGDPLAWAHAQALWHRAFAPPWVGFARTITWTLTSHADVVLVRRGYIELGLAVVFALLIVLGARRLPMGETVYAAAAWLVCVSFPNVSYGLLSLGRLLLPLIPCFLTLAFLTRKRWVFALTLVLFAALFAYLAQYFVRGYPIL